MTPKAITKKVAKKSNSCALTSKRRLDYLKAVLPDVVKRSKAALKMVQEENEKWRKKRNSPEIEAARELVKKYNLDEMMSMSRGEPDVEALPISKKDLFKALDLLEEYEAKKEAKQKVNLLTICRRQRATSSGVLEAWDSATHIINCIHQALLNHQWDHLTELLLFLLDHHPMYISYIKELTFLNLLVNKSDYNSTVLDDFLKMCFTKNATNKSNFNVWYVESEDEGM